MLYEMSSQLFNGETVDLEDMLSARERRSYHQYQLLQTQVGASLLCVTLNIPGPVKNSAMLSAIFEGLMDEVTAEVPETAILSKELSRFRTGCEYYMLTQLGKDLLKEKMIAFEQEHSLGRLLDLDVLTLEEGRVVPVSRTALGYSPRQCYLCKDEAKVCARSRKHSVEAMQAAIEAMLLATDKLQTNCSD